MSECQPSGVSMLCKGLGLHTIGELHALCCLATSKATVQAVMQLEMQHLHRPAAGVEEGAAKYARAGNAGGRSQPHPESLLESHHAPIPFDRFV